MKPTEEVVAQALEAFWSKVAELCPEAPTGDLMPEYVACLEKEATSAVGEWRALNTRRGLIEDLADKLLEVCMEDLDDYQKGLVKAKGFSGFHDYFDANMVLRDVLLEEASIDISHEANHPFANRVMDVANEMLAAMED